MRARNEATGEKKSLEFVFTAIFQFPFFSWQFRRRVPNLYKLELLTAHIAWKMLENELLTA